MTDSSLIIITTCNRLDVVKKFIWDYISFTNDTNDFDFLLSLDGEDEEYKAFCDKYNIPLIYSNDREGVGLSKNRVLELFPDYEYYFFIEDDVELINKSIFLKLRDLHSESGFHHFCSNHNRKETQTLTFQSGKLSLSVSGGAQFASYTNFGLKKVGGFNTLFAKYKRYGHTEHSYRFMFANLQPAPFIFPVNSMGVDFLVHDPPQVTKTQEGIKINHNELIQEEQDIIDAKTTYFELSTISKYFFNNKARSYIDLPVEIRKNKYPMLKGLKKRKALAEHYALKLENATFMNRIVFFIYSVFIYPNNNPLKHFIKTKIVGKSN